MFLVQIDYLFRHLSSVRIVYLENGAFYAFRVWLIVLHVDHERVICDCCVYHCIVGDVPMETIDLSSSLTPTVTNYYY